MRSRDTPHPRPVPRESPCRPLPSHPPPPRPIARATTRPISFRSRA
ncbi:hypothetical protein [Lysobacter gummosus]